MLEVDIPGAPSEPVICARCGADTPQAPCVVCQADPHLDGRYLLLKRLGHGASGTTFEARRLEDGQRVAVKELLVRRLEDFKTHDLFTREASVLKSLLHPGIPRYYDDFTWGEGRQLGLYLVTGLVEGLTLEEEQKLHRHTQREVIDIGLELSGILDYLHGLAPPVVHRDLKPSNVMRQKGGGLVLIDFGSVKESLRQAGGSTVAGTFGYMPPEQLAGRATPATDLYALGVMMVVLMTRRPVGELIDDQNRLQWQDAVPRGTALADALSDALSDVLEPDPNRRLGDAKVLARRLQQILDGRYEVSRPAAAPQFATPRALLDMLPGGMGQLFEALQHHGLQPGVADPPPPAPRKLPWGAVGKADPLGGFFRWFGVLFGSIPLVVLIAFMASGVGPEGLFLGLFPLVGGTLAAIGFTRSARFRRLYREGEAVEAVVTDAGYDTRLKINGRSPYRVTFRYKTADGVTREGSVSRMRIRPDLRVQGARVWALYDKRSPERATMWPIE